MIICSIKLNKNELTQNMMSKVHPQKFSFLTVKIMFLHSHNLKPELKVEAGFMLRSFKFWCAYKFSNFAY